MANLEEILQQLKAGLGGSAVSGSAAPSTSTLVSGQYNASAPTFSDGNAGNIQLDANGNQKVREQYAPGAEDNTANVVKTEARYNNSSFSVNGTISIINSTAGYLKSVTFSLLSAPTLTAYDNASGASGTVLFHSDAGSVRSTFMREVPFSNGCTFYATAGNAMQVQVSSRGASTP